MRITTRTNLAIRILMYCAAHQGHRVTRSDIAARVNASPNHTGHLIGQLAQLGFVETVRGRCGGLQLARPTDQISIGAVFRAFENGSPIVECCDRPTNSCPMIDVCLLRDAVLAAKEAFFATLDPLTLRDIACDNGPLLALLRAPAEAPRCPATA